MFRSVLRASVTAAALFMVAGHATAADKLLFAPPESWVKPVVLATTVTHESSRAPYAVMNRSVQIKFADDGDTYFSETAVKIQGPLGLAAGQPAIVWNPETETITVHKAWIVRDGKVIDLLAKGQTFTVMRREKDLEQSMMDGRLTAVIQTEGLQVGDVIDFAFSRKRKVAVLKGHSETILGGLSGEGISDAQYSFIWPDSKPMTWKASDDMLTQKVVKVPLGNEIDVDVKGYKTPDAPDQAPARFSRFGEIQFSQYSSWREVSALMGPLYVKAATLAPNSPLKAEIARIKAQSADPKVQAALALQLVQDKVRYVFIGANQGGLTPTPADVTWTKRYGDCKAKTTLLKALLDGLGIDATPTVVDTEAGDGMNERLPMVGLFNHVIIRSRIAGKTYWLDGTRLGDVGVDTINVPAFKYGLPLTVAGEDLQAMTAVPLDAATSESVLNLDASAGLDVSAVAHAEVIMRGDDARHSNMIWNSILPEDADAALRKYWRQRYDWIDIAAVSQSYDPVKNEMHFTMDGLAHMAWSKAEDGHGRYYETDGYNLPPAKPVRRAPGIHGNAPVVVDFPVFERTRETIVLPNGGQGFSIIGDSIDTTLANVALKRSLGINNGTFSMDVNYRSLAAEAPLADAVAAVGMRNELATSQVFLESPVPGAAAASGQPSAATGAPAAGTTPGGIINFGEETKARRVGPAKVGKGEPVEDLNKVDDVAKIYSGNVMPQ